MRARETWAVLAAALVARLGVVLWAHTRFPAAGDGFYYDTVARRIAHGEGYTWLWPDGAVTYAAHYPVGYPAFLGAAYAVFGASAGVAMVANALVGSVGSAAMHRLALRAMPPRNALAAGLLVALHPALVPYTAALMTEGVTAALLILAAACASAARGSGRARLFRVAAGVVLGAATLVRPQCLALAPILGALSVDGPSEGALALRKRLASAGVVLGIAVACCLPWTVRNCVRMQRCALVSVNGGWNLLIGAQTREGGWTEVSVPPACRNVWSEAAKDLCFEHAARDVIATDPIGWMARAPAKLAQTFDYIGASPWYMHLSNAEAFDEHAKVLHASIETLVTRLLLATALFAVGRVAGPRRRVRIVAACVGAAFALSVHAWVAYLALAGIVALRGWRAQLEGALLAPWTATLLAATAATHVVFFGAGRYGLVVLPFVAALAASLGSELPTSGNVPTVRESTPSKRSPAIGA
jgi:4-amino-4-deoxy-L-arabinose transferase-like glycosyltransferase